MAKNYLQKSLIKNINPTNLAVCKDADSFLQSAMWGEFKSRFGWQAKAFNLELNTGIANSLLVLSRRLAPGFSFAYVPWGPELPQDFPANHKAQVLKELAIKLKSFLARNTTFIRFDPPWNTESLEAELVSAGFRRAAADVQPPDTVIVNLEAPCEEILAGMKPKWRYNVSLAGKKGVQVKEADVQDIPVFYSLLQETAARDGIAVHSIDYYKTLFEICGEQSKNSDGAVVHLYTAVHEGDTLAAIIVLLRGKYATYLYGASSNVKRNLMAVYALQWKAMQDAKEAGCLYYDLFGIPPDDNPSHPMAGLYRFKTGFGGLIIHRLGSWDFSYRPAIYILFNIAEALRKKLRDRKKRIATNPRSTV